MTDKNIVVTGVPPCQPSSVEKALQELARMPVTEACVSGLCDICLAQQRCLCDAVGAPGRDSPSSRRSGSK